MGLDACVYCYRRNPDGNSGNGVGGAVTHSACGPEGPGAVNIHSSGVVLSTKASAIYESSVLICGTSGASGGHW